MEIKNTTICNAAWEEKYLFADCAGNAKYLVAKQVLNNIKKFNSGDITQFIMLLNMKSIIKVAQKMLLNKLVIKILKVKEINIKNEVDCKIKYSNYIF